MRRIEGKDGFVTFRRLPPNWQAKLEEPAEPAGAAAPSKAGPLHYAFLAALALAVAGACVGEREGGRAAAAWGSEHRPAAGVKKRGPCHSGVQTRARLTPPSLPACSAGRHSGCPAVLLHKWLHHL